jgi:hypothetical protein
MAVAGHLRSDWNIAIATPKMDGDMFNGSDGDHED